MLTILAGNRKLLTIEGNTAKTITTNNTRKMNTYTTPITSYVNASTIKGLRDGMAPVFLKLPGMKRIVIVDTPRRIKAYLINPSVGGKEPRALLLRSMQVNRRTAGNALYYMMKQLIREFPEGERA